MRLRDHLDAGQVGRRASRAGRAARPGSARRPRPRRPAGRRSARRRRCAAWPGTTAPARGPAPRSSTYGASVGHRARHDPPGPVELAGGDPGQPAARVVGDHPRGQPGRRRAAGSRRARSAGRKWSVKVSAQIHTSGARPARRRDRSSARGAADAGANAGSERRRSTPAAALATRAERSEPHSRLRAPAPRARPAGPARQPAQRVVVRGRRAAGVLLVQRLGLVGRHVDAGRAVGRAALAGQAEVERLVRPPGRRARRPASPSSASCSTRARPRVESFSSRVARYDGHITPPVARRDARADAGAPVDRVAQRAAVVGEPQRGAHRGPAGPGAGRRRAGPGRRARRG